MLAYDQPITRSKPDAGPTLARKTAGLNVLELAQLLWRRRTAIVFAGLIGACAAVAIGKSLTPKYLATAQLYVDPRELQLVDRELTPRSQDISGLAMVVESQARLITSNSVLGQVIQDTHLDKDPEFGGGSGGVLGKVLDLFGLQTRATASPALGQTTALDALNHHINVKKTDRSFIVDIDVWSYDPAKAAMLANAISRAYLAEAKNSQAIAARRATSDLSGRLKELQDRLRTAENALALYKAQNNFVGTQDTLITDQQLIASNQRLAAARAATLDAQARYDQIEASRRNAGDAGAIPEALQSPTLGNLRAQYAEARRKLAEMTAELGPLHPSLRQMEKQVEDLHRTINEEVDRFAQSAKNDLARARDYETSLTRALEAQKRQSVQLSQASVRLRELERDVEAGRDVYQSFLKRSRETEEQESLNTSNARIIGEATVPQRRSFPPAMSLVAAIGLVLGAGGIQLVCRGGTVVLRERRTDIRSRRTTFARARRAGAAAENLWGHACPAGRREAGYRALAGIGRHPDARRHPCDRRHLRPDTAGLADAAGRPPAHDVPRCNARHARGALPALGRQRGSGAGGDWPGSGARSKRRHLECRARGGARWRKSADDRRRSGTPRAFEQTHRLKGRGEASRLALDWRQGRAHDQDHKWHRGIARGGSRRL